MGGIGGVDTIWAHDRLGAVLLLLLLLLLLLPVLALLGSVVLTQYPTNNNIAAKMQLYEKLVCHARDNLMQYVATKALQLSVRKSLTPSSCPTV